MKTRITVLIGLLLMAFVGEVFAADEILAPTPEALAKAYEEAVNQGDEKAIWALWLMDEKNPRSAALNSKFAQREIVLSKGQSFSLEPWEINEDYMPQVNSSGMLKEWVVPPEGRIILRSKEESFRSIPYARTARGYRFVGQRATDLKWTGPPDEYFVLNFGSGTQDTSKAAGVVVIVIKYNASGISLVRRLQLKLRDEAMSVSFAVQRIEQIEVLTNAGPKRSVSIKREGEEHPFFDDTIPAGKTGVIYTNDATK